MGPLSAEGQITTQQENITKNSPIHQANNQQNSGYSNRIPPIYSNFINPSVQFQPR